MDRSTNPLLRMLETLANLCQHTSASMLDGTGQRDELEPVLKQISLELADEVFAKSDRHLQHLGEGQQSYAETMIMLMLAGVFARSFVDTCEEMSEDPTTMVQKLLDDIQREGDSE
mgnify:CR=1 FL=1